MSKTVQILKVNNYIVLLTGTDDTLRNGVETNIQDYSPPSSLAETKAQKNSRKSNNVKSKRVIQEPWDWYDSCYRRERNKGIIPPVMSRQYYGLWLSYSNTTLGFCLFVYAYICLLR